MTYRFYLVDVFAEQRYAGNQLAVVVADEMLSDEAMQSFAAETNYSETAFVTPVRDHDGGYRVRIFTPAREIAFAGHPILGTAWVLRHHIARDSSAPLRLNLAVGQINVTFEASPHAPDTVWFRAPPATAGPTCAREDMAAALGISPQEIDPASPVQQIASGTAIMIVPLRTLDALHRCRLDLAVYAPLAAKGYPPLVYLFCPEVHRPQNDYCARFFFEAHGVREDPATGNGAAFLGAYLLEHRMRSESTFSLRIEQGHDVRRPSLVLLRGRVVDGLPDVSVGGSVICTVRGELL